MSDEAVRVAFMAPKQRVSIGVSYKNIMSVNVPEYSFDTRTSDASDMFSYGFAFTSADLDEAVEQLSGVFDKMLKLAQTEKSCQLMAAEIEKTRRRVNALEHVMIPQLEEDIKYITMKLDENERSSQIQLMKVKDMMLEEAHHYEEREEKRAAQKAAAGA
jgi:V/A-type H+-transporting ATPase subunit D